MAGEEIINQTAGIDPSLIAAIGDLPGMNAVFQISKAVGVVVIVYLVVLIIRTLIQIKQASKFKKLAEDVGEINKKLDILAGNKKK